LITKNIKLKNSAHRKDGVFDFIQHLSSTIRLVREIIFLLGFNYPSTNIGAKKGAGFISFIEGSLYK